MWLEVDGKLESVGFRLFDGRQVFGAGDDVDMARGASAIAAAFVLDVDSIL